MDPLSYKYTEEKDEIEVTMMIMCSQNGWNNNLNKNGQMLIDIKEMITEIILPMMVVMTMGCQYSSINHLNIECQMLLHMKHMVNPNFPIHDDDDDDMWMNKSSKGDYQKIICNNDRGHLNHLPLRI